VPQVPDAIKARLAEFLPPEAGFNNPVDMIAAAPPESFRKALKILAEWDGIDAIIILYVPVLVTTPEASPPASARPLSTCRARSRSCRSSFRAMARRPPSRPMASRFPLPLPGGRRPRSSPRRSLRHLGPDPGKAFVPRYADIHESEGKALIADVLASGCRRRATRSPAGCCRTKWRSLGCYGRPRSGPCLRIRGYRRSAARRPSGVWAQMP